MAKRMPDLEKVIIVLGSCHKDIVITQYCIEHRIPRSTFYRWRRLVLTGLSTFMSVGQRRAKVPPKKGKNKKYKCRIR